MKKRIFTFTTILLIFFSCNNSYKKEEQDRNRTEIDNEIKAYRDKKAKEAQELKLSLEKQKFETLAKQGIIGKWKCNYPGFESIITFQSDNDKLMAIIHFTKSNAKDKIEKLNYTSGKYEVINSSAKEYYKINNNKELELWDNKGLFTTATNVMPGAKTITTKAFDIKNVIGMNIYSIIGNYSNSIPKTLLGTNNNFWIVYVHDLDVTFKVSKNSSKVLIARKGEINNLK